MIEPTIGFIGAGNMAEAIIRGLLDTKVCYPEKIICTDVNEARLEQVKKLYQVQTRDNNQSLVNGTEIIILAVKPQQAGAVLKEISMSVNPARHVILSIAAGLTTGFIETAVGKPVKVVRIMPNTPAKLRSAASAFCLGKHANENEAMIAQLIFESIGLILEADESLMDSVTAVSGSGPAYVFKLCEMMINSGLELGLDQSIAEQLTIQTIIGAARMLKESGQTATDLRRAVTSPGGTTEAALNVLDENGFERIFNQALKAAQSRGRALSAATRKEQGNG